MSVRLLVARARRGAWLGLATALGLAALGGTRPSQPGAPERLALTGLYADPATLELAPDVLAYAPQYPLWTDGAAKRRWIRLPPGASIDASDPDAWDFPVGTQVWKEFAFGRPVETRFMQRLEGGDWLYATYVWDADGREARLAPPRGLRAACESAPGVFHDIPGEMDCRACHEGHPVAVLGFGALQLSPDRDPLAPHAEPPPPGAVDLPALVERGLVRGLPSGLLERPPRIEAPTARARAALGYLHANCASCHNAGGPLATLGLDLEARLGTPGAGLATLLGRPSVFVLPGSEPGARVTSGDPARSVLVRRMASRSPLVQMPPLGTHAVDGAALELIAGWVREDLAAGTERVRPDALLSRL